ncbi:class GN sortase [uncultured Cohaesibacter sp.]|uniref:class GN sortase n=1 Tax=uncultured Cohaesibacter sp. TaxID=1002546 RepID=UPI0029C6685B|nr:class GN sortase [uncultured Cohaesibacter sp.]
MKQPAPSPLQFNSGIVIATALGLLGLGLLLWGCWIPAKAQLAQILLERAWQQSKADGRPHKAWPWADSWPLARLTIPALNFETIILKEAGGEGLAFGPVLLDQSAPLGRTGTSVIAAHRDTHFRKLADLRIGMQVIVEPVAGPKLSYKIDASRVARWDQSGLIRDSRQDTLVLSSCWPFDGLSSSPLRFIAEATPTRQTASLLH